MRGFGVKRGMEACSLGSGWRRVFTGELDGKNSPLIKLAVYFNGPIMLFHYLITQAQAEPGAFSFFFCGIERLEKMLLYFFRDPGAGIAYPELKKAPGVFGGYHQFIAVG